MGSANTRNSRECYLISGDRTDTFNTRAAAIVKFREDARFLALYNHRHAAIVRFQDGAPGWELSMGSHGGVLKKRMQPTELEEELA